MERAQERRRHAFVYHESAVQEPNGAPSLGPWCRAAGIRGDDVPVTSVETPVGSKAPGPSLRLSIVLIVAGVALMIPTLIAGIVPIVHAVGSPSRFEAPGLARMHLGKGTFLIYEDTGATSIGSAFSNNDNGVTFTTDDVKVTAADGTKIDVFERGSTIESVTTGGDRFVGAVRFRTPSAGEYTVQVGSTQQTSYLVARPLTDTIQSVLIWFLLAGAGGIVVVVGIVLLIVGSVRRGRTHRALAVASAVPAGWHPDPSGARQWRYWDGYRWTDHVQ